MLRFINDIGITMVMQVHLIGQNHVMYQFLFNKQTNQTLGNFLSAGFELLVSLQENFFLFDVTMYPCVAK